jgi:hypothetical protein
MERVDREVGGVALARRQPAERVGNPGRVEPGCLEQRLSLHEVDDRAPGRLNGAAARGVEARLDDPVALCPNGDADQIAAGGTAGGAGMGGISEDPPPSRSD